LQAYLNQISGMLADKERPLHRARPEDSLSTVARARTLTVLRRLPDGDHKASVAQFLYESGLIMKDYTSVDETGLIANARPVVNLQEADLRGANLSRAHLEMTNLIRADLEGANLKGARGVTQKQMVRAFGDQNTELPEDVKRPASWGASTIEHTDEDE
jgi:hypothetical protein